LSKLFKLNPKQIEQFDLVRGPATYLLAAGGSRSGKTAGFCTVIEKRALGIPGSRTGIFRSTARACRDTLFDLTYRQMSRLANPGLLEKCKINETEMTIEYPNGSVVNFYGLDDNARMERILGQEFLTIYINEISEIASFKPVTILMTRLSQQCVTVTGDPGRPKFLFDCNPPSSKHWSFKTFKLGLHPESNTPLPKPEDWQWLQMNPHDNMENLHAGYLDTLKNLSHRDQKRFIEGQWQTEVDGALFKLEWIDGQRLPLLDKDNQTIDYGVRLVRIIVAVDPAVSANPGSDETGIIVAGIDADGHGYILADRSMKGTPEQWAKAVAKAYSDFNADLVVYESNQGGLMVETTLRSSGANLPVKGVHASRGKILRAEPISLLYEKGQVSHVGEFEELEDQMASFTLDFNRAKQGSPDRLDALVWALTELMTVKQHTPSEMIVSTARGIFG
jgi:phage terminase large subunit-like protein